MFDLETYRDDCSRLTLGQDKLEEMISVTEKTNKKRLTRPVRTVLLTAVLAATLGTAALAANPEVAEKVQMFFGYTFAFTATDGSGLEAGVVVKPGNDAANIIAAGELPPMAFEVREGRSILTLDGKELDVTEAMEKDGYYQTEGDSYTLRVLPDGTAVVKLDNGTEDGISWTFPLTAEGAQLGDSKEVWYGTMDDEGNITPDEEGVQIETPHTFTEDEDGNLIPVGEE